MTRSAISQVGRHRIYRVLPDGLRTLQAEIDRFAAFDRAPMRVITRG